MRYNNVNLEVIDMNELKRKELGLQERLTNETFKLDERYKDGYFSASYFLKQKRLLRIIFLM